MTGRTEVRRGFDVDVRLALLEGDMDKDDTEKDTIRAELHEQGMELRKELKDMSRVLQLILASLATSAVLLAINLVVQKAG